MSKVFFTADLHFEHKAICRYRPFNTAEEHHNTILDNILSTVGKNDTLWILGDILFHPDGLHRLQTIADNVKVLRVVLGNHDIDSKYFVGVADHVRAFTSYKHYWISHCPIHPQEMRGRKGNIIGHLHQNIVKDAQGHPDPQYYCVSLEQHNYKPVEFLTIRDQMEARLNDLYK